MSKDAFTPNTDQVRGFWASDGGHVPAAKPYDYVENQALRHG